MKKIYCLTLLFLITSTTVFAQNRQKVGVALGGGAAKGFFHLGVLDVLEENGIEVEVVTGVSAGAQVGALYALGWSPKEILEEFGELNYEDLFDDKRLVVNDDMRRKIHPWNQFLTIQDDFNKETKDQFSVSSIFSTRGINSYFDNIYWEGGYYEDFTKFPRTFGAVAYDIQNKKLDLITSGSLAKAVRSSIALPLIMPPIFYENATYIDGGVKNNLPVDECYALGANVVIAIDMSSEDEDNNNNSKNLMSKALGVLFLDRIEGDKVEKRNATVVISMPPNTKYKTTDFHKSKEIYELGRQTAIAQLDELLVYKTGPNANSLKKEKDKFEPITVEKIEIIGSKNEVYLKQISTLKVGQKLTKRRLAKITDKIMHDRYFKFINIYHKDNVVYLDVIEDTGYKVGLNTTYTSDQSVSVGTSVMVADLSNNSATYFRTNLSYLQGFLSSGDLMMSSAYAPWLNFTASWFYNDNFGIDSPDNEMLAGKKVANSALVQGGIAITPHPFIYIGMNYKYNYINTNGIYNKSDYNNIESEDSTTLNEVFMVDTTNDRRNPSKGFLLKMDFEQAVAPISEFDFNRMLFSLQGSFRFANSGVSTTVGTQVGTILGDNISQQAYFRLGGVNPYNFSSTIDLPAFDINDFKARSLWVLNASLMYTFLSRFKFVFVDYSGAFINDEANIILDGEHFEQSLGFKIAIDMTKFIFEWGVAWDFDDAVPNFNLMIGNAF